VLRVDLCIWVERSRLIRDLSLKYLGPFQTECEHFSWSVRGHASLKDKIVPPYRPVFLLRNMVLKLIASTTLRDIGMCQHGTVVVCWADTCLQCMEVAKERRCAIPKHSIQAAKGTLAQQRAPEHSKAPEKTRAKVPEDTRAKSPATPEQKAPENTRAKAPEHSKGARATAKRAPLQRNLTERGTCRYFAALAYSCLLSAFCVGWHCSALSVSGGIAQRFLF
jgi:hypothetical protein